ncbi:MAG: hypothetical protein JRG80_14530 [Deltaproteobacteria bacterium]|nr:hypothetical protein [Deltaproteobacteria bacterium]
MFQLTMTMLSCKRLCEQLACGDQHLLGCQCLHAGRGRAAAATRTAREAGPQALRSDALPGRVLDWIGRAEQLHDGRPHQRSQVQRTGIARDHETTRRKQRGQVQEGRSLGREFGRTARPLDDRARGLDFGARRTARNETAKTCIVLQATRNLREARGRVTLVGRRLTRSRVNHDRSRTPREGLGHSSTGGVREPQRADRRRKRNTQKPDERRVALEAGELPCRQPQQPVREQVREFAAERRRVGDANRRSGKPRQDTRPQDGMKVDHQIEAFSAQQPDEAAQIARETQQGTGAQPRLQAVARKHSD